MQNNTQTLKNSLQPKFSFTSQLTSAIKSIQQKDTLEQQIVHRPTFSQTILNGTIRQCPNNLVKCFQSRDFMIFAIMAWENKLASNLMLVYFSKAKGQNQNKQIKGIKGRIISMEFTYPEQSNKSSYFQEGNNTNRDGGLIKNSNMNNNNKSSNNSSSNTSSYQIKLIMGNQDGFIKILDFQNKSDIQSYQIDTKAIVDIKIPPPQHFYNNHLVFALLQDYSIYIFNIKNKNVIAHFRPTIMMCDMSLSLSLHNSMKYLLQSTQGGYLILWKINQNLFKKLNPQQKSLKSQQKIYNVFPTSILHSASIDGIKWCTFLGDFVALITTKGIFKIIALNIQQKQQFAVVLQYQIQNGDKIKDAKLLPKQQCLIIVKQISTIQSAVQCIFYTPQLTIRHILRIKISNMTSIHGIILNKNCKYIFLRNGGQFFITYTKLIQDKLIQNKRYNDGLRQLQY